jgi:hypothetical protein
MHMVFYTVKIIATLGTIVLSVYSTNISFMHIWYSCFLYLKFSVCM